MRATYLIFGVIMMSLIVSGFGIVISDLTSEYDVAYDESSIEVYNKMNDTISLTEDIEAKVNDQTTNTGVIDLVGQFIGRTVDSLKLTVSALVSAKAMTDQAADDVGMPVNFKLGLSAMLVIFLFLGVIVSAMIKKDL